MRKGITVQMTTGSMITYLALHPAFEYTEENKQDATDLCWKVLDLSMHVDDYSKRLGMTAVIYITASIMDIEEILNTATMKELLKPRNGIRESFPPEAQIQIREFAQSYYEGYVDWISPFLSMAGVTDIDSELKDLDAIQEAIQRMS